MTQDLDSDIVRRVVQHDDREGFCELVRRHQSDVRNLLRRLTAGDHALADDLAQEAFIRAFRCLKSFQGTAKFSTWLYRIAYNVFLSSARGRASEKWDPIEKARDIPGPDQSDEGLAGIDLEKAFRNLTGTERATLTLAYGKGMTHAEIAQALGSPLGTVKTHIARAKEKVKQTLLLFERQETQ